MDADNTEPTTLSNPDAVADTGAGDSPVSNKKDYIVHLHKDTQDWLNGELMGGYRFNKIVLVAAYDEEDAENEGKRFLEPGYHVVEAFLLEDLRTTPANID